MGRKPGLRSDIGDEVMKAASADLVLRSFDPKAILRRVDRASEKESLHFTRFDDAAVSEVLAESSDRFRGRFC